MKKIKKTITAIFTVTAFALLMMFNVNTTDEGLSFGFCGETAYASDSSPCLENEPGWEGPRILNYTGDPDHALNCNHTGNGCVTCTQNKIEESN